MKTTLRKVVEAYRALGDAKVTKLDNGEVLKVVKGRKVMRAVAEDYEAFLKDVTEKMKPEGWDELVADARKWEQEGEKTTIGEARRKEVNRALVDYQMKVDAAVKGELEREVEVDIEKLTEDSLTKILVENGWEVKKLDELEVMM